MALATFKDLCIDAVDPVVLGPFWARALGLEFRLHGDGDAELTGPTPQHHVWINRVPEARTVKQRLHLDVHAASVAEHQVWGGTVLDDTSFRWTVMVDPEGGEYCVFVRADPPAQRLYELVLDAADPGAIATWWGEALEGTTVHDDRGFSYVRDIPGAPFDAWSFVPVPEPKTVKNRIHVDVFGDVPALVGAGATLLRPRDDEIRWHVLADPEGNEFCAFEHP